MAAITITANTIAPAIASFARLKRSQASCQGPRGGRLKRSICCFGVASAALPLLVLFPSLGYGPFGLRSGEAIRIDVTMLLGHVAFGVGIGLAAQRFAKA